MKVGDLVRHSMYSSDGPTSVVLEVRHNFGERRRSRRVPEIKIFDKNCVFWVRISEYEVVSESR